LAGEARGGSRRSVREFKQRSLGVRRRSDARGPCLVDVDVAGRAGTSAAALADNAGNISMYGGISERTSRRYVENKGRA